MRLKRREFELHTGRHTITGKLVDGIATVYTFETETEIHSRYDGRRGTGIIGTLTTSNHRAEWFGLLEEYVENNLHLLDEQEYSEALKTFLENQKNNPETAEEAKRAMDEDKSWHRCN